MDLGAYIALSIRVLTDLRVLGATVGILLVWALFRFVGIIVHRRPRSYQPKAAKAPKAKKASKAEKAASEPGITEE